MLKAWIQWLHSRIVNEESLSFGDRKKKFRLSNTFYKSTEEKEET